MSAAQQQVEFGYFYDSLNGLLVPACDPRQELHTLARLMTATFAKGRISEPHSPNEQRQYQPPWAPISSIVRVCHDDDIRTLTLTSSKGEFKVDHAYDVGQHRSVQVFVDGSETPAYEAALLGDQYKKIQNAVGFLAQSFFEQFPNAQCQVVPNR